jgi:phosphopentomutase
MWTGYDKGFPIKSGSKLEHIQRIFDDTTPLWPDMNFDSFYLHAAIEYVKEVKPRVVWIAFSETDEWAHEGRYDLYLYAADYMDRAVRQLWETVQSISEYRDQTTFILTCDHGRGTGPTEWKNHGAAVEGAEGIWIAIIGPDTPPLGERTGVTQVGQNQIGATLAALLGHDYRATVSKAGPPIADTVAPAIR